jgi:response regulator NasT
LATRVVIAEDEAIIRLDLKETLEEEGYEVVGETGRGDEAVQLVREHEPELAILDIKMPGQDGLAAAREIAAERRAAVLILTAFSQRDLIEQARDAGALAYLVKPFERNELIPAVEVALGRFKEMQALAAQTVNLEEQLETRKIVDRAKGRLMDEHSMGENDAFSFIQKRAMSDRVTMRVIAERIISGKLSPLPAIVPTEILVGVYVESDDEQHFEGVTRCVAELAEQLGYGQGEPGG